MEGRDRPSSPPSPPQCADEAGTCGATEERSSEEETRTRMGRVTMNVPRSKTRRAGTLLLTESKVFLPGPGCWCCPCCW